MEKFSITFGQKPEYLIERKIQIDEIINNFSLDFPLTMSYVITGVRGSGKTVLLTTIGKEFSKREDYIVIDINPEREILEQIASKLYESPFIKRLFLNKTFSFSFHGVSFSINGEEPVSNVKSIIDKMLSVIKKQNKKILLLIDEVSNTNQLKAFLHDYQSFLRDEHKIFLLMTGLAENVDALINSKSLTFLYRCPKIILSSLNIESISKSYKNIFNIDVNLSNILATLTNGYAFAYQVVGYLYSKYEDYEKIIPELDQYLSIYVYDKIFINLPKKEIQFLKAMSKDKDVDNASIIKNTNFSDKEFGVYRDRLIKRGLIYSSGRGLLSFSLPRFKEYLDRQM